MVHWHVKPNLSWSLEEGNRRERCVVRRASADGARERTDDMEYPVQSAQAIRTVPPKAPTDQSHQRRISIPSEPKV